MSEMVLKSFNILPMYEYTYEIRYLAGGVQILFRFDNGAGLSVVRHDFSYGSASGLFEAAPIFYLDDSFDNWDFVGKAWELDGFANRDDVKGWLDFSDVDELIVMVAQL